MLRWTTLIFTLLIAVAAWGLFHTSYEVRQLEAELAGLNRDIVEEQEAIAVLTAEWAYLNRPDRLGPLAHDLTRLAPIGPDQILQTPAELPFPLPPLEPAAGLNPVVLEGAMAGLPLPPGRPGADAVADASFRPCGRADASAVANSARTRPGDLLPVRGEEAPRAAPGGLDAALPLVVPTGLGALIEGEAR